jgi:hypothetical protein
MKYALCEWERNGRDDSDFFVAEYDDETGEVTKREIGSTRYAGGNAKYEPIADPAMVQSAAAWLAARLFMIYRAAEDSTVMEPDGVANGTRVRLLRDVKHKGAKYPAGSVGVSFYCDAFGTFYSNGYKTKNRYNLRVGIRMDDGAKFFAACEAIRLDREPLADDVLRANAVRDSRALRFTEFFGGAWPTHDFAGSVMTKARTAA